jgi:hypothetical protein
MKSFCGREENLYQPDLTGSETIHTIPQTPKSGFTLMEMWTWWETVVSRPHLGNVVVPTTLPDISNLSVDSALQI